MSGKKSLKSVDGARAHLLDMMMFRDDVLPRWSHDELVIRLSVDVHCRPLRAPTPTYNDTRCCVAQ